MSNTPVWVVGAETLWMEGFIKYKRETVHTVYAKTEAEAEHNVYMRLRFGKSPYSSLVVVGTARRATEEEKEDFRANRVSNDTTHTAKTKAEMRARTK